MDLQQTLEQIAAIFLQEIRATMAQMGLGDSTLYDTAEARVQFPDKINIWLEDYGIYVIKGRKKFARKVPIMPLIEWIKKKGIQGRNTTSGRFISVNSLAYAIQTSIFKNGILGRDFITPAIEGSMDIAEQMLLDFMEADVNKSLDDLGVFPDILI